MCSHEAGSQEDKEDHSYPSQCCRPARSAQGPVHSIDSIGGADEHHLAAGIQAVHEGQQGADDAVVDLVLLAAPHLYFTRTSACKLLCSYTC